MKFKTFFFTLVLALMLLPYTTHASIVFYTDKSAFLDDTGATSATGPMPNLGLAPGGPTTWSQTVGTVTFTAWAQLWIGTGDDSIFTTLISNPLAISSNENFNVDLASPVFSFGFDMAKPVGTGDPILNYSLFTVTLKNGSEIIEEFTFAPPFDQVLFYGIWSDTAFNHIEFRETTGADGNEYFGEFYTGKVPLPALPVAIDIKPGVYPNTINLSSREKVAVAILSTEDFDASTQVDPTTITFAGATVLTSKGKKGTGGLMVSIEDVNADGLSDMVLYFDTQALELTPDSTEAVLTGETYDGMSIMGKDSIKIASKGKK